MRKPLPGEGVVEDEHVDAGDTDLELALDVLLVGIASGGRNEHLGERTGEKYWRLRGSSEPQFAACVNSEQPGVAAAMHGVFHVPKVCS